MSVWKGVVNYLSLERGYHKLVFVNDMKRQRKMKIGLHKCASLNPSVQFYSPVIIIQSCTSDDM